MGRGGRGVKGTTLTSARLERSVVGEEAGTTKAHTLRERKKKETPSLMRSH
jgi:hypothetical protein